MIKLFLSDQNTQELSVWLVKAGKMQNVMYECIYHIKVGMSFHGVQHSVIAALPKYDKSAGQDDMSGS